MCLCFIDRRFESPPGKKSKFDADAVDDTTNDGTLFRLLNYSQNGLQEPISSSQGVSFANAFSQLNSPHTPNQVITVFFWQYELCF